MNVVIYARYSSHSQQETSIEGQLRVCHEFCEKNNYNVVDEYIDRAMSGKTDRRPAFLKMIKNSARKKFQAVIVYQLDRFARNRYDSATYKARLKANEVRVISARENITDDASGVLMEGILESMAEYYSEELKQKVTRGMYETAQKCQSTGGNIPLGFKVGEDKKFHIDQETAPIVKKIFEMYADGSTTTEITTHLNELGYKTKRGGKFNKNSLRTMLQNKRYLGIYTYKDMEIPDGMPRIISDELFTKVQKRMEKNKIAPARKRAKVEYLLTTKLFCGYCKEMMTGFSATGHLGKVYRYYKCNGKDIHNCKKKPIHKDRIEDIVIARCRQILTSENINKIAKEVTAFCMAEQDTYTLKELKKQLSKKQRQHSNLIEAIAECEQAEVRESLYDKVAELNKQINELKFEIEQEDKDLPIVTEKDVRFFLHSLKKGDINDIKYRKTLINVFVNSIYLFDDKVRIILNIGETTVTITDSLLEDMAVYEAEAESLFRGKVAPPKKYTPIKGVYFFVMGHRDSKPTVKKMLRWSIFRKER